MSVTITVKTAQITDYVEKKRATLIDMLAERIDLVDQMFADRVRGNLSGGVLQTQSGKLLSTVMQTPAQISGNQIYGAVTAGGTDAPYGIYFEEGGTGYYEIRPINARVLAFMGEGGMIFAKLVNHPPTPKLPWFQPEVDAIRPEMNDQLNQVFAEVLKP